MRICIRCKQVKIDTYLFSQFFSEFMGIYTAVSDVCKKCSKELAATATWEYQRKNRPQ